MAFLLRIQLPFCIFSWSQSEFLSKILKNMTLDNLKARINNKLPVIVLLQARPGKPVDYADDGDDGYYLIAIGYDERRIFFVDP